MAKIIQTSDFVGYYALSQNNFSEPELQSFIDKYETRYLRELLGKQLADLFLADITTPFTAPQSLIYQNIFNEIWLDTPTRIRSTGIKNMLLGFINFHYSVKQPVINTITGNVFAENEASKPAPFNTTDIYDKYNESVFNFNNIAEYVYLNKDVDYPLFYYGYYKRTTSEFV